MTDLETKRQERRQAELEAAILAARGRGDEDEVSRLQREYRSAGFVLERYGPAPTVVEGTTRPRAARKGEA